MISKLGLFSSNETKEDVSTANLKYLLVCLSYAATSEFRLHFMSAWSDLSLFMFGFFIQVPYYLGEMTEQVEQEDRIPVLKASQDHLKVILFCPALVMHVFFCV